MVAYSPDLWSRIFTRFAGGEELADICREPGMPSIEDIKVWRTGRDWVDSDYRRAVAFRNENSAA